MLNFTVGPVMMDESVKKIGGIDLPYFRTQEFSEVMLYNEKILKKYFKATDDSRVIFLTGSGTAAMDAVIQNTLTSKDKIIVINGGSFGNRFAEICKNYHLNYFEIKCKFGKTLTYDQLLPFESKGFTALLVNLDETSSGVLYDIEMISNFCKRNNIFLIVDSISSFLCDPFDMKKLGVDVVITGSQKALALAPGISIVCINQNAIKRISIAKGISYYFDFKKYLINGERGQTPFTPAVSVLLQLNERLKQLELNGGVDNQICRTEDLARYFRNKIKNLPLEFVADRMSNAVTCLRPIKPGVAYKIFETLKDEYNIFICPNGGELKDKVFRVGHIGNITYSDLDILISCLSELHKRDIF